MQTLEPLPGHVSINLGGRKITMAQQKLHDTQIGAVVEQVRRKGMPQPVRRDVPPDVRRPRMVADAVPERLPRQALAAGRDEHLRHHGSLQQFRAGFPQVGLQPFAGLVTQRNQPLLVALANHPDDSLVEVQIGQQQAGEFAYAQTRRIHQFQHRPVAQTQGRRGVWRRQQALHLFFGQGFGQAAPQARALDQGRRVLRQPTLAHLPPVELPVTGQVPRQRAGTAARPHFRGQEGQDVFARRIQQVPAVLLQRRRKLQQVPAVALQGIPAQPALGPCGVEERVDLLAMAHGGIIDNPAAKTKARPGPGCRSSRCQALRTTVASARPSARSSTAGQRPWRSRSGSHGPSWCWPGPSCPG